MNSSDHFDPDDIDPAFVEQKKKEIKSNDFSAGDLIIIVVILLSLALVIVFFTVPFIRL